MLGFLLILAPLLGADEGPLASAPFRVTIVDDETDRGVPLVELRTVNDVSFWTDSQGVAALFEPGLMGRKVFFTISSHGYEFPADGFGIRGRALQLEPGGEVRLRLQRTNLAERLYRITGAGIYRDSQLLGLPVPVREPLLASGVLGCDSVLQTLYRQKLFWVWGDTNRAAYPLGNFHVTGATSSLPDAGGLAPEVGIDFDYFADNQGADNQKFVKPLARMPGDGPTWIDSLTVLPDTSGTERLYASYVKVKPPLSVYARGIAVFDDERREFRRLADFPHDAPLAPRGHSWVKQEPDGDYVYFATPYPLVRVPASPKALVDPGAYQTYTCLQAGPRSDQDQVIRDDAGRLVYAWRNNTPAVGPSEQAELIKQGKLASHEGLLQLRDAEAGRPVLAHAGSVAWNGWRQRWVMITVQQYGTSLLGEVWYAEADTPQGPWAYAVKVVSHQQYSFYNPKHHPLFDQDGGKILFFEGTYTTTFSGNNRPTPRYEYNQIMYRLDLSRPRLALPVAVYLDPADNGEIYRTGGTRGEPELGRIAFFALDRRTEAVTPIFLDRSGRHTRLTREPPGPDAMPQFFIYPPGPVERPTVLQPLFEIPGREGTWRYVVGQPKQAARPEDGPEGAPQLLGYVWPSPWSRGTQTP